MYLFFRTMLFANTDPTLIIGAGGDVAFGRYLKNNEYRSHGGENPFGDVNTLFEKSDLVFVNLETPLHDDIPPKIQSSIETSSGLIFRADEDYAHILSAAGIDIVSIANNHLEDCGKKGIQSTQEVLALSKVAYVGADVYKNPYEPTILHKNDIEIVIFGRSTRRNFGSIDQNSPSYIAYETTASIAQNAFSQIKAYKQKYPKALFLYSIHWGEEYRNLPTSMQRKTAHQLIDAGIDVVLGHHTHVLQPIEIYNDGVILYSMGNLIFDQLRQDTQKSAFFQMEFVWKDTWIPHQIEIFPLQLQTTPLSTTTSTDPHILETFRIHSHQKPFETDLYWENNKLIWQHPQSF